MKTITHFLTLSAAALTLVSCGSSRLSSTAPASGQDDIINIGYGTTTKKTSTYASSSVRINENEIGTYATIYDYLRGRVPGVDVASDNSITIRGINSINGPTDPLILVDDVETDDISGINPRDVANISVLKDSSASIYGARGGNGVILITLKH